MTVTVGVKCFNNVRYIREPLLFVYAVVRYLRRRLSGLCTAKFKSC